MIMAIVYFRYPMNTASIKQGKIYKSTYEQERLEVANFANEVAPKDNPVLWTGHGYPAYLFNGYVVDYSGLNFSKIWSALKEVKNPTSETKIFLESVGADLNCAECATAMLLIRDYHPNVFMAHGVFNQKLQKTLNLRLAGSFYLIDLANAPAYRVFVVDAEHPELNTLIPLDQVKVLDGLRNRDDLSITGKLLELTIPKDIDVLQFGILQTKLPFVINVFDSNNKAISSCSIPALKNDPEVIGVFGCKLPIPRQLQIVQIRGERNFRLFEPLVTRYLEKTP
jgi:hypothetical protein